MKLEKFKKNQKIKKTLLALSGIMILLVGGIILYRSYALYQENRSFNVLKGTVPNFNRGDMELAIKLDGETVNNIPTKGNYDVVVNCGDTATGEWSYEKWGAIITDIKAPKVKCSVDFSTGSTLAKHAKIGDYVEMISENSSINDFLVSNRIVDNRNYNPQELNLWRVIKVNNDGTVEAVSENITSFNITFKGYEDYENLITYLIEVASLFSNSKYTRNVRCIGYNGQTDNVEAHLGETDGNEYQADVDLVKNAVGTLGAKIAGEGSRYYAYWLSARDATSGPPFYLYGRIITGGINAADAHVSSDQLSEYGYPEEGEIESRQVSNKFKPIITLKAGLKATGSGTSSDHWKLQ